MRAACRFLESDLRRGRRDFFLLDMSVWSNEDQTHSSFPYQPNDYRMKKMCKPSWARQGANFPRSICLFLLSLLVAGCPAGKQTTQTVTEGKVVIKGSNTIGEELAPRLIAEYRKDHPGVSIDLESK